MARLKLVHKGNPILTKPNADVKFPLDRETRELVDQMVFSCKKFKGVGLAAPQIGRNLKLAIINLQDYELPAFPIFNPVIESSSKKTRTIEEGCLSIPGKFAMVERPEEINVRFQNFDGKEIKIKLDGFAAVVFQHEIDHLNGIIISDKWDEKTVHIYDKKGKSQAI